MEKNQNNFLIGAHMSIAGGVHNARPVPAGGRTARQTWGMPQCVACHLRVSDMVGSASWRFGRRQTHETFAGVPAGL